MPLSYVDCILQWYIGRARDLPWRSHSDPYAVWVSEIMLQQTRVETVIPYFLRWMERFPTVASLAEASQQEALAAWEGLGYYSRARNLHRAAQVVMRDYGGRLPALAKLLRSLPGIGRYSAGAIASIAFGLDEPVLDGNIRRVLARLFNLTDYIGTPQSEKNLWRLAAEHLPTGKAGIFNQAMMDFGATLCTPRAPDCPSCPLNIICKAYKLGVQEERPIRRDKPKVPHYIVTAAVIQKASRVLVTQRPPDGLLGGMWEFPGGKVLPGEEQESCLKREIKEELGAVVRVGEKLGVYQHAYTHYRITLHAFHCTLLNGSKPRPLQVKDFRWLTPQELPAYPMGKIDRQIAYRLVQR